MARGKGKRGGGRGAGKRFAAQSAEEIEQRNSRLAQFDERRAKHRAEAAAEENGDDVEDATAAMEREAMLVGMRVARMNVSNNNDSDDDEAHVKKERKNKGLEGIIEMDNPNKSQSQSQEPHMTRKQREEAEKAEKAAAYRRRHEMGLTEEYKRDMAKLAEVKRRREVAQAKAQTEKDAEDAIEAERKEKVLAANAAAKQMESDKKKSSKSKKSGGDNIPKLDKITIKKMKPAILKEALKERGLEIQGNAKALMDRLLKYETSR